MPPSRIKVADYEEEASIKQGIANSSYLSSEVVPGQDDTWLSTQQKERNEMQKPEKSDARTSINLTHRSDETSSNISPPCACYPLLERSAATFSGRSLEICTECLGSETGSDGFSSHNSPLEISEEDREEEMAQEKIKESCLFSDMQVGKLTKSPPVSPSPPPLLSSTVGRDLASLHIHSRRENGKLVLEAVSVPKKYNFHAQRRDGRLVLTLPSASTVTQENHEVVEGNNAAKEVEFVMEPDLTSLHKSGPMTKNPTWFNEFKKTGGMKRVSPLLLAVRLAPPPPPPATAAALLSVHRYLSKSAGGFVNSVIVVPQPKILSKSMNGPKGYKHQDLEVDPRGNTADYLVPCLMGCLRIRKDTTNLGAILHSPPPEHM